jgi:hypothetical protein
MIVEQHTLRVVEMLVLRARLGLEIRGLKPSGPAASTVLRKQGYSGQRLKMLADLNRDIEVTLAAQQQAVL